MCTQPPSSKYLKAHDALFTDVVLTKFNEGIDKVDTSKGTEKEQIEAVVAALRHAEIDRLRAALHGANPFDPMQKNKAEQHKSTFSQMKTMVKLGQLTLKWRRQAVKFQAFSPLIVEAKRAELKLRVMKADLTVAECWYNITRRTDHIYRATEDLLDQYLPILQELTGGALSPSATRTGQPALPPTAVSFHALRRTRRPAVAG